MHGGMRGAVVMTRGRIRRLEVLVQKFIDDAYEVLRPRIREWNKLFPSLEAVAYRWATTTLVRGC